VSARVSALAVVIGVITAAAVVTVSLTAHVSAAPVNVQFDGVALTLTYLNRFSPIFGLPNQTWNACLETLPSTPPWPGSALGPGCPNQLIRGSSYDFAFFVTGNPGYSPGLWVNLTLTAPFNFSVNPGSAAAFPTVFSNSSGLFEGGGDQLFDTGSWWGWDLVFTFPQTFESPPGGLWLHATLTVQPTIQTNGP